MNDEIKILAVGAARMILINDDDYKNLLKVRKFLTTIPEYGEDSQKGNELYEMADRIDNVYLLHTAYRKSYEQNKNYSLKMQEIINECGGFITFKEYIGMSFRISEHTLTSFLDDIDMDLYKRIANDDNFPVNADASWKAYRLMINYIMKNYEIFDWYDIRDMYREYQAIIEGRWYP